MNTWGTEIKKYLARIDEYQKNAQDTSLEFDGETNVVVRIEENMFVAESLNTCEVYAIDLDNATEDQYCDVLERLKLYERTLVTLPY